MCTVVPLKPTCTRTFGCTRRPPRANTCTRTSRSPVAYLGALMTSLEAQGDTDPAVYAGIMTLLERALAHVPRAVLLSKGPRIAMWWAFKFKKIVSQLCR